MNRRELLGKLGWSAGVCALPFYIQATAETSHKQPEAEEQREEKPPTTASLAASVLRLMDKAERAGMKHESEALRACAEAILRGGK